MSSSGNERQPKLIVLAGISGVGKSTMALAIARQVGNIAVLETDQTKIGGQDRNGYPMVRRFGADIPSSPATMRTAYEAVHKEAATILSSGQLDVLIAATYRSQIARQTVTALAADIGADLRVFHLVASQKDSESRVSNRPPGHISGITNPGEIGRMMEGLTPFPGAIIINTSTTSPEATLRRIVGDVWGLAQYRPDNLHGLLYLLGQKIKPFQKQPA